MRFHRELYIGDSVRRAGLVKWKLKHHAGQLRIFVIVLSRGQDQLEIIHCAFLQQKYYRKIPLCVVGIAGGYEEALVLLQRMVADVFAKTGGYGLKDYFIKNEN